MPSPSSHSVKKVKAKTPPQSQSSLLFSVGSSAEKEQQRIQKKLQQLKELGIDLPSDEMMALLQRNCFSVPGAASEYFERLTSTGTAAQEDEEAKRRLERVLQKLENVDTEDERFKVLGKTTMQASVNRQGVKLKVGEELLLRAENAGKKRLRPGLLVSPTASGIVRVATLQQSQVGRLERNMETLLHPLMKSGLVRLGGVCETPPVSVHMFASFDVTVFVYVSVKAFDVFKEGDANFHLSDQLYNLLQMINGAEMPSLDALASRSSSDADDPSSQVNPEDLDTLFSECVGVNELHNAAEGSDADPSEHLVQYLNAIELRDHQKQALRWMLWRENQSRNGVSGQESNNPMWEERHFRSNSSYYVNPFEKSASLKRPQPPAPCLGGILADDMGMGKTMMMLSLVTYQKHVGEEKSAMENDDSPGRGKRTSTGKTLVVCPLSLLHQWKNEAQERFLPNTLSVHVYYGDDRGAGDGLSTGSYSKSDLVLTTYGVLSAEFGKNGLLTTTEWNRVILDEAHSIKTRTTGYFKSCSALIATHRWCLTGTPIQNTLDDMFSLLCFLQYQPWSRVVWWKRVITKPYEDGDDVNALGRLKAILTPILLRRTKHSRDKQGNMIVKLPPKQIDLVKLEFSPDERAFYQAVFDKSRAEFNGFVASGAATTSYVAIFALLLRLRQACDHPLLALGKDFEQALKPDDKNAATSVKSAFQPQQNESSEAYYQRIAAQLQKDMQASSTRAQLIENGNSTDDQESASTGGLTASYIQSVIAQSRKRPRQWLPRVSNCGGYGEGVQAASPSKAQSEDSRADNSSVKAITSTADDDGTGFESAKLQQLLRDLQAIKLENENAESPEQKRKVVVFSQWTSMLEMVSQLLTRHNFSHCTFNGGLTQEARERVLTEFAKDPDVEALTQSHHSLTMLTRSRSKASKQPVFIDDKWNDAYIQTKDEQIDAMLAADASQRGWDELEEENSEPEDADSDEDAWHSDSDESEDNDEDWLERPQQLPSGASPSGGWPQLWPLQSPRLAGTLSKVLLNLLTLAVVGVALYGVSCSVESMTATNVLNWRQLELESPVECGERLLQGGREFVKEAMGALSVGWNPHAPLRRLDDDIWTLVKSLDAPVVRELAALLAAVLVTLTCFHRVWAKTLVLLIAASYVAFNVMTEVKMQQRAAVEIFSLDPTFAFVNESIFNLEEGGSVAWAPYWGGVQQQQAQTCPKRFPQQLSNGGVLVTFGQVNEYVPCYLVPRKLRLRLSSTVRSSHPKLSSASKAFDCV
ncbi:P-loop containing nucleoside triphosphate hydrolase [Phytophthora cactorum]|nr:P-loop containing nucleoside triphosphate hydrolase [Phytophthora cactorum]